MAGVAAVGQWCLTFVSPGSLCRNLPAPWKLSAGTISAIASHMSRSRFLPVRFTHDLRENIEETILRRGIYRTSYPIGNYHVTRATRFRENLVMPKPSVMLKA